VALGDRLPELEPTGERQITVVLVPADRLPGGGDRLARWREIGVQVLEPEDPGIAAGGFRDPVDRESGDGLQPSGDDPCAQGAAPDGAPRRRQADQ
jgi:hypothetical protein